MATGGRISINSDKWRRVGNEMLRRLQEKDSETAKGIADIVIFGIIFRTRAGLDVNNKTFTPYSKAYAKKKGGGSAANLYASGKLLSREGFEYEVLGGAGKIYIRIFIPSNQHSKGISHYTLASVHNFGMRSGRGQGFQMPEREFMGITKKIEDEVNAFSLNKWREIFQSLNAG